MNPFSINPLAALAAVLVALAIGFGGGWTVQGWRLNTKIANERVTVANTAVTAVSDRVAENKQEEAKQDLTNRKIEVTKNEELAPVVQHIAAAPRLRVGAGLCIGAPARAPEAQSTGGSDDTNPPAGLVREDVDRDLRSLEVEVEKALATGRACQQFVRDNGLSP